MGFMGGALPGYVVDLEKNYLGFSFSLLWETLQVTEPKSQLLYSSFPTLNEHIQRCCSY